MRAFLVASAQLALLLAVSPLVIALVIVPAAVVFAAGDAWRALRQGRWRFWRRSDNEASKSEYDAVLITGATSGIGEALAVEYAAAGVFLALTGRDESRLETVAQACRDKGATVVTQTLDVTSRADMEQWVRDVDAQRKLKLVIANAGVSASTLGAGVAPEEATNTIWETNVLGCVNTIMPVLPRMEADGCGHLVAVSSLASYFPTDMSPAYAASKAGVRMLFECLRLKYRGRVNFSVVCPGFVRTKMSESLKLKSMPFEMTPAEAAVRIRRGIEANEAVIAFPWLAHFVVWTLSTLPPAIQDALHASVRSVMSCLGAFRKAPKQHD